MAQEADAGVLQVDAGAGLKELDHGVVAVDLQHLAAADVTVGQLDFAQLIVSDALHLAHHHQRAVDLLYGFILADHASASPLSATASISRSIWAAISA